MCSPWQTSSFSSLGSCDIVPSLICSSSRPGTIVAVGKHCAGLVIKVLGQNVQISSQKRRSYTFVVMLRLGQVLVL